MKIETECPQCRKRRLVKTKLEDGTIESISLEKYTLFDKEFFHEVCWACEANNRRWVAQKMKMQIFNLRVNKKKIQDALDGKGKVEL